MNNMANWYWIVADDQASVWSSARAISVPVSDADYVAWSAIQQPSQIASMDELYDVLIAQYPPGMLETYCTFVRDRTAGGGITVNGRPFATDVITLGSLNSAYIYTQANASATFSWKLPDGTWVTLGKQDVAQLQAAVSKHGQDCFDCEADTLDAIEAGTITTHAVIDAAFAAVPNTFTDALVAFEARKKRRA